MRNPLLMPCRATVVLVLSCVTMTLLLPAAAASFEADPPGLTLSFVPQGIRANRSGTRVVLWAQKQMSSIRDNSPPSSHMALIDATVGRVLIDKLVPCRLGVVAVDDHYVYASVLNSSAVYALSLDDLSSRGSVRLPDEPAVELASVGGKYLIAATERGGAYCYSVPDLKPAFKFSPLVSATKDTKNNPRVGAAASVVVEGDYVRLQGVVYDSRFRGVSLMRPPAFITTVDSVPLISYHRRDEQSLLATNSLVRSQRMKSWYSWPDTSIAIDVESSGTRDTRAYSLNIHNSNTLEIIESLPLTQMTMPQGTRTPVTPKVCPVGKTSVIVTLATHSYLCDLASYAANKRHLLPAQSSWTVAADKRTELRHALVGAKSPIKAELMSLSAGVSVDPSTAIVTVDGPALMPSVMETLALKFGKAENPFAPGSLQLQQYTALVEPYFKRVVGRDPKGLPLLVHIDLQVTDANDAKMHLRYYVFLEIPTDVASECVARSEAEAKQRAADPSGAPDRRELISRADKLVQELRDTHYQSRRFDRHLKQVFQERLQLLRDAQ